MSQHPLLAYSTGPILVHVALGRLISALIVGLLIVLSVRSDRAAAKRELSTLNQQSYAARYSQHLLKVKKTATQTDGDLIAIGVVVVVFVGMYEAGSVFIGWALGVLDNAVGTRPRANP